MDRSFLPKERIMFTTTTSILEDRTTTGRFDPSHTLDDLTITELVRLATQAPTAFNLQNWSFIAVRSDGMKERLVPLAYGQRQVRDAAVTFIVCGALKAYPALEERLQPSVDAGIITDSIKRTWVEMAASSHANNPQLQRDEAMRSASLAAMALMIAARELGLDAGVLGGFDHEGISQEFSLTQDEIPIVLVTVGRAAEGNWPQKIRRPVTEILQLR